MTTNEIFASRLKALREESGLSQSQMAEALGVSRGSISFYENGERTPDISFLAIVKEYFRVQLDYLLGYTDKKFAENPVIEINDYSKLPQYVQGRIDTARDRMAKVAGAFVPASGDDPNKLFDCIYADVLSTLEAYESLSNNLPGDWANQEAALKKFKTDLNRSSEVTVIRHLYEQDFKTMNPVIKVFHKDPATIEAEQQKSGVGEKRNEG